MVAPTVEPICISKFSQFNLSLMQLLVIKRIYSKINETFTVKSLEQMHKRDIKDHRQGKRTLFLLPKYAPTTLYYVHFIYFTGNTHVFTVRER